MHEIVKLPRHGARRSAFSNTSFFVLNSSTYADSKLGVNVCFQDQRRLCLHTLAKLIGRYVSGRVLNRYRCQCQQCTEHIIVSLLGLFVLLTPFALPKSLLSLSPNTYLFHFLSAKTFQATQTNDVWSTEETLYLHFEPLHR